jgi:hypothetical protein
MDPDFIKEFKSDWDEEICAKNINLITTTMAKYNTETLLPKTDNTQFKHFVRDDYQLWLPFFVELDNINKQVLNISLNALKAYAQEYSSLVSCYDKLTNSVIKYQQTSKSGGYHSFHIEHCGDDISKKRVLSWILYLNTLETEGGETEFLYFNKRIKPEAGKIVVFPATWPWVHRGNPPRETKHILTGWFYHNIIPDSYELSKLV